MQIIDYNKYVDKINRMDDEDNYWRSSYKSRWVYFKEIIEQIKHLDNQYPIKSVLEIGAFHINFTDISANMDLSPTFIDQDSLNNYTFIRDARVTPYDDIWDKMFDLVICCQVFEHFQYNEYEIFKELQRICYYAIITIPWMWNCPDNKIHHQVGEKHVIKYFGKNYKDFCEYDKIHDNRRMFVFNFNNV